MQNKLRFSEKYIEIECQQGDIDTQSDVSRFYPVTSNRKRTLFRLSSRFTPEVLSVFRNIDEHNINAAPTKIQEYYFTELRARQEIADLLENR